MGCEQSRLTKTNPTHLSIVDSGFLKPERDDVKTFLLQHNIVPEVFMNIDCFLESLQENYSNNVVIREQDRLNLKNALRNAHLSPHIYILGTCIDGSLQDEGVTYFNSYQDLPPLLEKSNETSSKALKTKGVKVDVKILKDFKSDAQSQLFIFQETLKVKNITYQLYNTFGDLQKSQTTSELLVTDYKFHRAAVALGLKSRVICYCDLVPEESYDPGVFFATNNFQQIVNQIIIFKKLTQPILPISKIYFYTPNQAILKYGPVFQHFKLRVKVYSKLTDLIKTTRLYFSVMIICHESDYNEVDKKIKEQGCSFRLRVIPINDQTECSAQGLRKVIKEVKRGYLVERTSTKVVDIIDKYHSNIKFQEIKKELVKNNIEFRCYSSVVDYCRNLNYIAPVIICNFDDRQLLHRFLEEVQIKTKVVIFCNRAKITEQLSRDTRWAFVSSHFGKIIKYIKTHHVLFPLLFDQNQEKLQQKQENMKSKQHRVSAIKWVQQSHNSKEADQSFIIAKSDVSPQQLKDITADSCSLLKLPEKPLENIEEFKKNLIDSLEILRTQYKINVLDSQFNSLLTQLKAENLQELMERSRKFLGDGKEMGIGLNKTLRTLQKLKEGELKHIRELLFLLNLNFLGFYGLRTYQSTSLCCWTRQSSFELCKVGNFLLSKNFLVMRQEGTVERIADCIKLQIDLEYSTYNDQNLQLNSYFIFQGRYIFAPYTQLQITQIDAQNDGKVIHLKLIRENSFLRKYTQDNLGQDLHYLFEEEMKKDQSSLIDPMTRDNVHLNLQRMTALQLWRTGEELSISKAVTIQRQLIRGEEESQNFDSRLQTELKFQLCKYLLSQQNHQEVIDLIAEIKDSSPSPRIKKQCAVMLLKLKNSIEKKGRPSYRAKSIKCIELKQQIQQQSEEQSEDSSPIQDSSLYQNLFQCLEVDEKQGLAEHFS